MYLPVERYIDSIHEIETDLSFWRPVIEGAIQKHQELGFNDFKANHFYSSFTANNFDLTTGVGRLSTYVKSIPLHEDSFLRWITALALLRVYNAVEVLLFSTITEEYLKKKFSLKNLKALEGEIFKEVQATFSNKNIPTSNINKKNNRHIIQLIKLRSSSAEQFLSSNIRVDLSTTQENLFEFISILRHIIAHNAMVITPESLKIIEDKALPVYERYFTNDQIIDKASKLIFLNPIQERFSNFLNLVNDFALNTVKFVKGEPDLRFTEMNNV